MTYSVRTDSLRQTDRDDRNYMPDLYTTPLRGCMVSGGDTVECSTVRLQIQLAILGLKRIERKGSGEGIADVLGGPHRGIDGWEGALVIKSG